MSKNNLSRKLTNFFDNNEELVNKYHRIPGIVNLYDIIPDIIDRFNTNPKLLQNSSLQEVMKEALNYSIQENQDVTDSLNHVANKDFDCYNTIQIYFKEVGKIYDENDNEFDIEYCEENKDLLIKMNLKSVISVAKQYQGMGVELSDLISAGNLGLCKAWEKFNPSKINIGDLIKEELPNEDVFQGDEILKIFNKYLTYGKAIEKARIRFKSDKLYSYDTITKWVDNNIKPARFSSVAVMWIKAYILAEIDQHSRLVRKPKSDIYKDKEKYGVYLRETTIDIDQPINFEDGITVGDTLGLEDESNYNMEINDSYNYYKTNIRKLLHGLKPRSRSILLKRFGIGLPRPMSPKEIGVQENLTISRVCQIFQNALNKVKENAQKLDLNVDELFAACAQFK